MTLQYLKEQGYFEPPSMELDPELISTDDLKLLKLKKLVLIASIKDSQVWEMKLLEDGSVSVDSLPVHLEQSGAMAGKTVDEMIHYLCVDSVYQGTLLRKIPPPVKKSFLENLKNFFGI